MTEFIMNKIVLIGLNEWPISLPLLTLLQTVFAKFLNNADIFRGNVL
jgi:hypothetical protein